MFAGLHVYKQHRDRIAAQWFFASAIDHLEHSLNSNPNHKLTLRNCAQILAFSEVRVVLVVVAVVVVVFVVVLVVIIVVCLFVFMVVAAAAAAAVSYSLYLSLLLVCCRWLFVDISLMMLLMVVWCCWGRLSLLWLSFKHCLSYILFPSPPPTPPYPSLPRHAGCSRTPASLSRRSACSSGQSLLPARNSSTLLSLVSLLSSSSISSLPPSSLFRFIYCLCVSSFLSTAGRPVRSSHALSVCTLSDRMSTADARRGVLLAHTRHRSAVHALFV